ncbi:P07 [Xanthomonas phage phiL7]|uniref:p07 n=1 Tax=Xanthomonas phage phiL7 TaxID=538979 RepID=C4ML07_9CAUD|nr:HNH endonuclease [Xanthomonas phage phiL7]ACE75747.1 P07 [Xanthomonas phage phiL7]
MSLREALMNQLSYDKETGEFRWKQTTCSKLDVGQIAGCHDGHHGYVLIRALGTLHRAHRLAWLFVHGRWPGAHLDHINGNRQDNRLCNLRECTSGENHQNTGHYKNNKSGYMGVSWNKRLGKWHSKLSVGKTQHHLGYYPTPELAHQAYLEAKQKLHTFQPIPRESTPTKETK